MFFLIDYENVKNLGMLGVEHLLPDDHVIIFYSESTRKMESRYLEGIERSQCEFSVCKLLKQHKNALDFYISTKAGEIFGSGFLGSVVIVSHDTGFQAVKDYWSNRAQPKRHVVIAESIERGIVSANESGERLSFVCKQLKTKDIGGFFDEYERTRKLKKTLQEAFADTEFSDRIDEIEHVVKSGTTPRILYLETLRHFGRKGGLTVYQSIKKIAGE